MIESEIIACITASANASLSEDVCLVGNGDDAAVLKPYDASICISTDTFLPDTHFPAFWRASTVGYRSLAGSVSDIAAMGAVPIGYFLSLVLPEADGDWAKALGSGFNDFAANLSLPLLGGNLAKGAMNITLTVLGKYAENSAKPLCRYAADVGDLVYVSGLPGAAWFGCKDVLKDRLDPMYRDCAELTSYIRAYCYPSQRVTLSLSLSALVTSMTDISDGLLLDSASLLPKGMGIEFDFGALTRLSGLGMDDICAPSDDYELCFTVSDDVAIVRQLESIAADLETPLTVVGRVIDESRMYFREAGAARQPINLISHGYDHFS